MLKLASQYKMVCHIEVYKIAPCISCPSLLDSSQTSHQPIVWTPTNLVSRNHRALWENKRWVPIKLCVYAGNSCTRWVQPGHRDESWEQMESSSVGVPETLVI